MSKNKFNEIFEAAKAVMLPLETTFKKFTKLVEFMKKEGNGEFTSKAADVMSFCNYYCPLLEKEEIWGDPEFGKGPPIIGERGTTPYSGFVSHLHALVYEERFRRWLQASLFPPALVQRALDFIPYLFHNEAPPPGVTLNEFRSLDLLFSIIYQWKCVKPMQRWSTFNKHLYEQAFLPLLEQQKLPNDLAEKASSLLPPFLFGKDITLPAFTFDELDRLQPFLKSIYHSWVSKEAVERAGQLLERYDNTCYVAILRTQAATRWSPRLLPPARPGVQTVIHPHLVVMQAKL